jgi:hypothetical protein
MGSGLVYGVVNCTTTQNIYIHLLDTPMEATKFPPRKVPTCKSCLRKQTVRLAASNRYKSGSATRCSLSHFSGSGRLLSFLPFSVAARPPNPKTRAPKPLPAPGGGPALLRLLSCRGARAGAAPLWNPHVSSAPRRPPRIAAAAAPVPSRDRW